MGENGPVSEYDDQRPDPGEDEPGPRSAPSYPPPSLPTDQPASQQPGPQQPGPQQPGSWPAPQQPGPYGPPYGSSPQYGPSYASSYASQHPERTQPLPMSMPAPTAPRVAGAASRLPGWLWPVIAAMSLVVGLLGGALGGGLVSLLRDPGASSVDSSPPVATDNGAVAPLKADNGSIAAVAARVLPSTVQIQANGGADGTARGGATGSGFVLDTRGHVITNNHVVAGATGPGQLKVVDQNGHRHAAKILGRSPVYDLAVLDVVGASKLRPAAIGSSRQLRVGDTVVAIGSPLGLSSTVTSGIVSAADRPVTTGDNNQSSYIDALQTDAAINPGNSGGPLVNLRGQVVGVNSAIATTGGAVGGQSGNIGVGFAIPMEQVRITAGQILSTGQARYPVIGANVSTGPQSSGAAVADVPAGTPAARGGLRKGDVVTSVDGKPVTNGIGLIVAIRSHRPGETVDLGVLRRGTHQHVRVTLDSKVG